MRRLRIVHALAAILAGTALALVLVDLPRAAIVVLAIVTCLQVWSLEMLRTITLFREIDA